MRLRGAAVALLALGHVAAASPTIAPITSGTSSDEAAVVALAFGDSLVCSGTVIAPHAVLTAAHCLAGARLPDVVIGGAVIGGAHHTALAGFLHPGFDAQSLDHDIALVLVLPLDGVAPLRYATSLDGAAAGSSIRVVGYGWTIANDASPAVRRAGNSQLDAIDALRLVSHAAPSQACEGDSGGPTLFGGAVLGVTSSGDPSCTQFARHTRVDIHAGFIADAVTRSAPGAAAAGDRCWYDANCATGACLPALDEPRWSFCSPSCATDDDCAAGLACLDAACRYRAPSPGAEGASCEAASDCAGALCLDGVCTTRCFSDLPGFPCPSGESCRAADDGTEACFADTDDGGCHATRGSRASLVLVLLALFAIAPPARARARRSGRARPSDRSRASR